MPNEESSRPPEAFKANIDRKLQIILICLQILLELKAEGVEVPGRWGRVSYGVSLDSGLLCEKNE